LQSSAFEYFVFACFLLHFSSGKLGILYPCDCNSAIASLIAAPMLKIFGNLMILASAAVANFPSSVNESFTLFLCGYSGKLAKILAANEMSSVTISIPAWL
jgi:hypothetical protein